MHSSSLTEEQLKTLQQVFARYSSSKTNVKPVRSKLNEMGVRQLMQDAPQTQTSLSIQELNKIFVDAMIPIHQQTLQHIFSQLKPFNPRVKTLTFNQLLAALQLEDASQDHEGDYAQIFALYDRKGRGFFDFEDYKVICRGVQLKMSEAEMKKGWNALDKEGKGEVNLERFTEVMQMKDI